MKRLARTFGPLPWSWAVRWKYFKLVTVEVFWRSDTTAIRALMAVGSVFFAIGLLSPFHTFSRPIFKAMAYVASEQVWAYMFALHALGVLWRIYAPTSKPGWGFAINAFGLGIWMFSTCLIYYAVGEYTPSNSMELAIIIAAFVALLRTGLNDEVTAP